MSSIISENEENQNSEFSSGENDDSEKNTALSIKELISKLGTESLSIDEDLSEEFAKEESTNILAENQINSSILERDIEEWNEILLKNNGSLYLLSKKIKEIRSFFESSSEDSAEGISFLDAKTQLFLSYMQFLYIYMLMKAQGKPIQNHPIVKRLIYIKSLLLKLKPIEKKLDYQINKLLRVSTNNNNNQKTSKEKQNNEEKNNQEDPLNFKARPDKLQKAITTEDLSLSEGEQKTTKNKEKLKYKPPKISASLMKEDKLAEKRKKQLERKKKFLLRSSFINDLGNEFSDRINDNPLQIEQTPFFDKEERDRTRFEEEHFIRLPFNKKEKVRLKKKMRLANEDKIDDFREMENIREILKLDGMIEESSRKEENVRKLAKTLHGAKKNTKNIKKFKRFK